MSTVLCPSAAATHLFKSVSQWNRTASGHDPVFAFFDGATFVVCARRLVVSRLLLAPGSCPQLVSALLARCKHPPGTHQRGGQHVPTTQGQAAASTRARREATCVLALRSVVWVMCAKPSLVAVLFAVSIVTAHPRATRPK